MAGAGWKTWVAGERVDADDFQTYLQDQVVPVFSSTSARDAAITAPSAGMTCRVTATGAEYSYTGSAWVVTGWYASTARVGCSLRRVANQTIGNGVQANITWDTEDFDGNGFITVSSDTVTIPSGLGGVYSVSAAVACGSAITGEIYIVISSIVFPGRMPTGGGAAAANAILPLAPTDTVSVAVFNNSGASRDFTGRLYVYRLAI